MKRLLLTLILVGVIFAVTVNVPTWTTDAQGNQVLSTSGVTLDPNAMAQPGPKGDSGARGLQGLQGVPGNDGAPGPSVPFLYTVRELQVVKNPGAATVTAVGLTAPTVVAGKTLDGTDGPWVSCTTTTTSGTIGSILSAYTQVREDWSPEYIAKIKTGPDVTNVRIWVGLFSATPTASATPNLHLAAFRYDTGTDLTAFWRCATFAGTGSSGTTTTTTRAIAANTVYTLRLKLTTTSCAFYVNDTLVATNLATLPTSTTLLGYGTTITNLTTAVKSLLTSRLALMY